MEFVRDRIDRMSPTQVGVEMLDQIISVDPRVTQGIGGDNMTVMIIDLQPESRKGRVAAELGSSQITATESTASKSTNSE